MNLEQFYMLSFWMDVQTGLPISGLILILSIIFFIPVSIKKDPEVNMLGR